MSNFKVKVVQTRGNSFENGLKIGTHYKNNPILASLKSITKPEIDYENMKSIFTAYSPHLLDELEGLSESIGISLNRTASLFSGYDLPRVEAMGCSALITNEYYVRNYDFSPLFYDGLFTLTQSTSSYASAGYNLQGIGRHDGVNEHGLVVGLHFVNNNEHAKGMSAWTTIRMILDTCSTVNEAISLLKEIPHSASYNFSMGDPKGNLAVVETSPEKILIRDQVDSLSCTNHFQHEMHVHKNRQSIDSSVTRDQYMQDLMKVGLSQYDLFEKFSSKYSPLFYRNYDELFGTLHTFSYSFKNGIVLTAIAQSEQLFEVDFKEWVRGNGIRDVILEGKIENR
ncbi:C45 family peptidase [Rossellomorea aquimaris]|uniref:C45 family autoproteolytic acyltransferase/hydolase n=1 Tax=Rossellomorea aquimaris TaxID=189382 RepID=UPI001CD6AF56|nr:C45 family peptidase [Rossellomorea aquimaris]MCA1054078.1 C45 family peptidase [Rossellomorea aquimaris]